MVLKKNGIKFGKKVMPIVPLVEHNGIRDTNITL